MPSPAHHTALPSAVAEWALGPPAGGDMAALPRTGPRPLAAPHGRQLWLRMMWVALVVVHLAYGRNPDAKTSGRTCGDSVNVANGCTTGATSSAQRWIMYRRRQAVGDLFPLAKYPTSIAALASKRTTGELGDAGSVSPGPPSAALDARAVHAALRRRSIARLFHRGAKPSSSDGRS